MAIDTRDKRASAGAFGLWDYTAPVPDGALDTKADRSQMNWLYSGIELASSVPNVQTFSEAMGVFVPGPATSGASWMAGIMAAARYLAGAQTSGSSYHGGPEKATTYVPGPTKPS